MNILNKLMENPKLGTLLYVERQTVKEYVDGKASDDISGYKYICVLPQMSYAQVQIKILGAAQLEEPTNPYEVTVEGLSATVYVDSANRPAVAFRASKIRSNTKA